MRVCIVGLGYIGLPCALMMAAHGVDVTAVDSNAELVNKLRAGKVTFKEEGLPELFDEAVSNGVEFRTECIAADMYIVAVPTPYLSESKRVDAVYVAEAVGEVLDACEDDAIMVVESTVSPGTIDRVVRPLIKSSGRRIRLAHAPERIIPGNMLKELRQNARTIGCDDSATGEQVRSVYATFCQGDIELTDIRTAEMSKVVENTFRDINIAFANELARICRAGDMDVYEIIRIANKHPRVNILQPGPGVGGHCISVDPWFLVGDYPEQARLIRQARIVNSDMPAFVLDRIRAVMADNGISEPSLVGLYGLTYKEDVDDIRESPTGQLLEFMRQQGFSGVKVYDPIVERDAVDGQYHDFEMFLRDVSMVVVLVAHSQLRRNPGALNGKVVLDTRHIIPGAYGL